MAQGFIDFLEGLRQTASDSFLCGRPDLLKKITADKVVFFDPRGHVHTGAVEVYKAFDATASRFAGLTKNDFATIQQGVEGNFGYWIGIQSSVVLMKGGGEDSYELRLTEHYERQDGLWKLVFRHASPLAKG